MIYENEVTDTDATIYLRLYLSPGGRFPYDNLFRDMSKYLREGKRVMVLSVPGFPIASGDPKSLTDGIRPWYHEGKFYRSPQEVIRMINGTRGIKIGAKR